MDKLEIEYFNWLCDKIFYNITEIEHYKLVNHLYNFTFIPSIEMDNNREDDGKQLRYRFGRECEIPSSVILRSLDTEDTCSILELMVALALRCEETIMTDSEFGDRTELWFWNMINSLGLSDMNDRSYDEKHVDMVLDSFNDRRYNRNGEGGLFTIPKIREDLRNVEIWYQMCWYLDTL